MRSRSRKNYQARLNPDYPHRSGFRSRLLRRQAQAVDVAVQLLTSRGDRALKPRVPGNRPIPPPATSESPRERPATRLRPECAPRQIGDLSAPDNASITWRAIRQVTSTTSSPLNHMALVIHQAIASITTPRPCRLTAAAGGSSTDTATRIEQAVEGLTGTHCAPYRSASTGAHRRAPGHECCWQVHRCSAASGKQVLRGGSLPRAVADTTRRHPTSKSGIRTQQAPGQAIQARKPCGVPAQLGFRPCKPGSQGSEIDWAGGPAITQYGQATR